MEVETWEDERLPDLLRLWNRSCPGEPLTVTELTTVIADGTGTVLASSDGRAAIAFTQGVGDARQRGNVRLLVVAPEARGHGLGRTLLAVAEERLRSRGVDTIRLAGGVPRYLWPGIDTASTEARALARSAGYGCRGTAVNMTISTGFRARTPAGIDIRWVDADGDSVLQSAGLQELVREHWPLWLTEVQLAAERGTLCGAWSATGPIGFIAHSTMRSGWIGPMGTHPGHRGGGVGAALLSAVCTDLAGRDHASADIAWVGPVDYFAAKGARVTRTFERYVKEWA